MTARNRDRLQPERRWVKQYAASLIAAQEPPDAAPAAVVEHWDELVTEIACSMGAGTRFDLVADPAKIPWKAKA